jgi:hypothetical protein
MNFPSDSIDDIPDRDALKKLLGRTEAEAAGSAGDGIELFPKQDLVGDGQFGNAIRGPLGVNRAANRRYWFYGAVYELEAQMAYLRTLRRVTEAQLKELIADLPEDRLTEPRTLRHELTVELGYSDDPPGSTEQTAGVA